MNEAVTPEVEVDIESPEVETVEENVSYPDVDVTSPKKPLAPTEQQRFRLKVNGAEKEFSLEQVLALARKADAADQRFQAASQKEKQAQKLVEILKEKPFEVLAKMGIDVRELSQREILQLMQEEAMSPEARKAHALEKELQQYKLLEQQAKQKEEEQQAFQEMAKHKEHFHKLFSDALEKAKLPKNTATLRRMAQIQQAALNNDVEITADQIAEQTAHTFRNDIQFFTAELEGPALLDYLGEDTVKKVQKALMGKLNTLTGGTPKNQPNTEKMQERKKDGEKKRRGFDQAWREMRLS